LVGFLPLLFLLFEEEESTFSSMFALFPLLKLGDEIRISINLFRALLNFIFSGTAGELGIGSTMLTPSELPK
jgi:hypothetical protein